MKKFLAVTLSLLMILSALSVGLILPVSAEDPTPAKSYNAEQLKEIEIGESPNFALSEDNSYIQINATAAGENFFYLNEMTAEAKAHSYMVVKYRAAKASDATQFTMSWQFVNAANNATANTSPRVMVDGGDIETAKWQYTLIDFTSIKTSDFPQIRVNFTIGVSGVIQIAAVELYDTLADAQAVIKANQPAVLTYNADMLYLLAGKDARISVKTDGKDTYQEMTVTAKQDADFNITYNFQPELLNAPIMVVKYRGTKANDGVATGFIMNPQFITSAGGTKSPGQQTMTSQSDLTNGTWEYLIFDFNEKIQEIQNDASLDFNYLRMNFPEYTGGVIQIEQIMLCKTKVDANTAIAADQGDITVYDAEYLAAIDGGTSAQTGFAADGSYVEYTYPKGDNEVNFAKLTKMITGAPYLVIKMKSLPSTTDGTGDGKTQQVIAPQFVYETWNTSTSAWKTEGTRGATNMVAGGTTMTLPTQNLDADDWTYYIFNMSGSATYALAYDETTIRLNRFRLNNTSGSDGGTIRLASITLCKTAEIAEAAVIADQAKIESASVTVNEDYKLNFYIPKAPLTDANYTVELNGTQVTPTEKGDDFVITCDKIGPHMIADEFTATLTIYADAAKTVEVAVIEKTYSVAQYCKDVLADASASAELKAVCKRLLNYGAAAQAYKGVTENFANAGNEEAAAAFADTGATATIVNTADVIFKKAQVVLNNGVEIFVTVEKNGETEVMNKKISLAKLDEAVVFADGEASLTYSVAIYGNRSYDSLTSAEKTLFNEVMAFSAAVKAYVAAQ